MIRHTFIGAYIHALMPLCNIYKYILVQSSLCIGLSFLWDRCKGGGVIKWYRKKIQWVYFFYFVHTLMYMSIYNIFMQCIYQLLFVLSVNRRGRSLSEVGGFSYTTTTADEINNELGNIYFHILRWWNSIFIESGVEEMQDCSFLLMWSILDEPSTVSFIGKGNIVGNVNYEWMCAGVKRIFNRLTVLNLFKSPYSKSNNETVKIILLT